MNIFLTVIGLALVSVGGVYGVKAWRKSPSSRFDSASLDVSLAVSLIAIYAGLLPLSLGVIGLVRG